jgi:hypothetical protein
VYCIIRFEAALLERARACRELCKNTHVQIFGLIEEFDSNSWFCVSSLCIDVEWYAHECLLPVIHLLYMLCI